MYQMPGSPYRLVSPAHINAQTDLSPWHEDRVAKVRENSGKNNYFSRSVKSQGIF